ncbi:MAG: DUF4190 domain-containing protein [Mycolicibacterium hassiacum]|jgi:hypothetical protein
MTNPDHGAGRSASASSGDGPNEGAYEPPPNGREAPPIEQVLGGYAPTQHLPARSAEGAPSTPGSDLPPAYQPPLYRREDYQTGPAYEPTQIAPQVDPEPWAAPETGLPPAYEQSGYPAPPADYPGDPGFLAPGGYPPQTGSPLYPRPEFGASPPGWGAPPPAYPPPAYPAPGYPQPGYGPYPPPTPTNGLAIASLVCSMLGLICGCVFSVPGIVLGLIALNQTKTSGGEGRGLAIAGIALSCAGLLLFMALMVAAAIG